MSTPDDDATQAALAIMTAWATSEGTDFVAEVAASFSVDDEMGSERLVTGFINLTGLFLTKMHGDLGEPPVETLQWAATQLWDLRE